tara:strand:+ start:271 stop:513 length:243 start_codon:yes stop_codon:yes gene_type:complete
MVNDLLNLIEILKDDSTRVEITDGQTSLLMQWNSHGNKDMREFKDSVIDCVKGLLAVENDKQQKLIQEILNGTQEESITD